MDEVMIYKVLEDCEVKKLGERSYEFTASTSTQDRDKEIIDVQGWDLKNFKKNPVIMYAHDYRTLPIGRAPRIWVSSDSKLKNVVEFPPEGTYEFADIVERLVDAGYLKTESVGFIPKKWEDGDGDKAPRRTYLKQELLEISIVPVPSNPDALRDAVEDGVITAKQLDAITKPEETDDWIRIPVAECKVTATIDISKEEGIKALYCGKEKKVRTYMFDKRTPYNWTMAKAKKWVKDHEGKTLDEILEEYKQEKYKCECIKCGHKMESEKHCRDIKCSKCGGEMRRVERPGPGKEDGLYMATDPIDLDTGDYIQIENGDNTPLITEPETNPKAKQVSQEEIIDELDYLIACIKDTGINEDAKEAFWNLVREGLRLTGDDIPDDILAKVGAVLSAKNKLNLKHAQNLIQGVLDSAGSEQESIEVIPTKPPEKEIAEAVAKAVVAEMERLKGKVS